MPIITLTTDFGQKDGFAGVLKGVIWGICPEVQIADITHGITPQNVMEAALALQRAAPFFPGGAIHIAVVDPGVGTNRRPMAARLGDHYFVGPDNGIFSPMIEEAQRRDWDSVFVQLDRAEYWLPEVSRTFHGRDVFAPVGAHLARGVNITDLGSRFNNPIMLPLPRPVHTSSGWDAHITIVDTFGNITLDLRADQVEAKDGVQFLIKGRRINGMVESYGRWERGELIALVDSEGFIEIAVVNGSAARDLQAAVGDTVQVLVQQR